jgi:ketosteroid isomerase-like protein
MSQENVEIVRRAYHSLRRRDWDALSRDAHRKFVIHTQLQGSDRSPRAAQRFVEDRTAPFEAWTLEPEGFWPRGDLVTVFLRSRHRLRGSHAEILMPIAHVWTLRDRKLVSLHTFVRRADATAIFGLRR